MTSFIQIESLARSSFVHNDTYYVSFKKAIKVQGYVHVSFKVKNKLSFSCDRLKLKKVLFETNLKYVGHESRTHAFNMV